MGNLKNRSEFFTENKLSTLTEIPDFDYRPTSKQVLEFNKAGEVVRESIVPVYRSSNGGGFVLSYSDKLCELAIKVPVASILRVFVYIAHHQQFGTDGVYGLRCSRKHLQEALNIDRKSVYTALKWLSENFIVNELKVGGVREFMVNPNYVTVGTDRKSRLREWSRRWEIYWVHKNRDAVVK